MFEKLVHLSGEFKEKGLYIPILLENTITTTHEKQSKVDKTDLVGVLIEIEKEADVESKE